MALRGIATGVAYTAVVSALFISVSSQGWDGPKCREIVLTGNEYKFKAKSIDEMIAKIESTNIDQLDGREVRSPWEMGMIPNLAARKLGYQYQLKMIAAWAQTQTISKVESHRKALQVTESILRGEQTWLTALPQLPVDLDLLASQTGNSKDLDSVEPLEEFVFCAYFNTRNASRCYQALTQIIEEMAPVDNITARHEIFEVLSEPAYRKPLAALALEYTNLIESGKSIDQRYLDEDLLRVLGSEKMKWKVLAVLAARGANFYKLYGYASKNNFQVITALGVIASSALYFDSQRPQELFSFPKGVKVSCDSGKAYHFWMAAYLSMKFGSKWAAYLASVGYQMRSSTEFRKPERAFMESWNSVANQKIRIDLAYSSVGARYGEWVRVNARKPLRKKTYYFDLDEKLDFLENGAEMLEPLSKQEAIGIWKDSPISAFIRWNRIFHPERALN